MGRLIRHVIKQVVIRGPKVAKEAHNYVSDLPNMITLTLAPSVWLGNPAGYNVKTASRWLSGYLEEMTLIVKQEPGATSTDITHILDVIETTIKGLQQSTQRRPMLALYILSQVVDSGYYHRPALVAVADARDAEMRSPSLEAVALYIILENWTVEWSVTEWEGLHHEYWSLRYKNAGLRFPRAMEAAFTLLVAEHHRLAGDNVRARDLIAEAVESYPDNERLQIFEKELGTLLGPINYRIPLQPSHTNAAKSE
jgi:hypothetical protein